MRSENWCEWTLWWIQQLIDQLGPGEWNDALISVWNSSMVDTGNATRIIVWDGWRTIENMSLYTYTADNAESLKLKVYTHFKKTLSSVNKIVNAPLYPYRRTSLCHEIFIFRRMNATKFSSFDAWLLYESDFSGIHLTITKLPPLSPCLFGKSRCNCLSHQGWLANDWLTHHCHAYGHWFDGSAYSFTRVHEGVLGQLPLPPWKSVQIIFCQRLS